MERISSPASPPTERDLLDELRQNVASALPDGWTVELAPGPKGADALLTLNSPDGRTAELLVEAKSVFNARDVPKVGAQFALLNAETGGAGLVASRYLAPRARAELAAAGISYADATGNLRLALRDPAVFLLKDGANRDPWRAPENPTDNLRGVPAARVVRALVDFDRRWGIRELAATAQASLASTSRIVNFLEREALVERDDSGPVTGVEWPALIERWAVDYDLSKRRRVLRLLAPRGAGSVEAGLKRYRGRYAISGSLAADRWAPYAESALALVYADDAASVADALELREAPVRPNVLLIEPEDGYVFFRSTSADALTFVQPAQVAVDLLVGPGRSPDEGHELIRWMKANEDAWRAR